MNHGENFEYDLMPSRDWELTDKPIRVSPTIWEKIRAVARRRSVECEQTGVMTLLQCRHLSDALCACLNAGDFSKELVPVVERVVALLGQRRGVVVQRRSSNAGSALQPDNHVPVVAKPVMKLADEFEKFRIDKSKPAR